MPTENVAATVDARIVFAILVTILVAVLTAMGAILKVAYDASQRLLTTMHGDPDNGDEGFISESRKRHERLDEKQENVYDQLLIQGQLLTELTYAFSNVAEELADAEDVDIDVNTERIEDLRDRKDGLAQHRDSD